MLPGVRSRCRLPPVPMTTRDNSDVSTGLSRTAPNHASSLMRAVRGSRSLTGLIGALAVHSPFRGYQGSIRFRSGRITRRLSVAPIHTHLARAQAFHDVAPRGRRGPPGHGILDDVSGFAEFIQHGLDAGRNFPTGSRNERAQERKLLVGHGCPPSAKAEEIAPAPRPNQSHCVNGCDDPSELWQRLRLPGSASLATTGKAAYPRVRLGHMPFGPHAMAAMPLPATSA